MGIVFYLADPKCRVKDGQPLWSNACLRVWDMNE